MTPRIGSLCSGYGGLDLGLMAVVGGSVAWHVEYDKHPSAILDARFPGVPNYGDVTTTDWTQVEPVDWLTAGYPCQPFSHAGKRRGSKDERHLWPFVADAIGALRPGCVLLENVAGHVSLGLDVVLADLASLGYDATWGVVRAADAGAPHNRERVFVIATDADTRGRDQGAPEREGETRLLCDDARATGAGAAADARCERHGSGQDGRSLGRVDREDARQARQRERPRPLAGDRSSAAPAYPGSARLGERPADAPAEEARSFPGDEPAGDRGSRAVVDWGSYAPAIQRWEHVTGRAAPRPTEPGRVGERLSPRFVEWLMGLSVGWVTDVAIARSAQLKALGNGVVPQQAALAITVLMQRAEVAA